MEWYLSLALVLIGVGIVALAGEFLAPTGGVLVVVAVACFAVGVGAILLYGDRYEAVAAVIGLAVGIPAMTYVVMSGYRQLALKSVLDTAEADTEPAAVSDLDDLRGRVGKTVSPLRPAGVVLIDNRRVDGLSEGPLLDADIWVKCVAVRGAAVVVRPVEPPAPLAELTLNELD